MKQCLACNTRTDQPNTFCPVCARETTDAIKRKLIVEFLHRLEQKEKRGEKLSPAEERVKKTVPPVTDRERAALSR